MVKVVPEQILQYFSVNDLKSHIQHTHKADHSTCTALTAMTDRWLTCTDNNMMFGTVPLDFSAAFDIVDH